MAKGMEGMNLQPHLGRYQNNYKSETNFSNLVLAKVIEIHHKMGTVDVQIVKTNDAITSGAENEGRFAARVGTVSASFNRGNLATSGTIEPMVKGQMVILGFLDGLKTQPFILCSSFDTLDVTHNILPGIYPLSPNILEDVREAVKYLKVHPTQFYTRIDGVAGVEVSHPSKSFLKMDALDDITDAHMGTDHADLQEKDPNTFNTRSGRAEESSFPINVLYNHRSSFDDDETTWTKFFLSSEGMLRVTRDNRDDKLTYVEMPEDGGIRVRRQVDSPEHGQGTNFTQAQITEDGKFELVVSVDGKPAKIAVENGKVSVEVQGQTFIIDPNNVSISSKGNINLNGNLQVTGNIQVNGNLSTTGTMTMGGKTVATVDQLG